MIRKASFSLVSGLSLVLIIWLVVFGRMKVLGFLSPLVQKIPKDQTGLTKITDDILGMAAEKIRGGNLKKAVEKGSEVFEGSDYAEPAREMRENVKQRINEVVESVKELPAKEVKIIQKEVCKAWLGEEVATESGGN